MMLRTVFIWFGLLIVAILNGGFRETFLVPWIGRGLAQALSTVTLSLLIVAMGWVSVPWVGPRTPVEAWTIGVTWVGLTLAFEFLGGHFIFGKPWPELLADYHLFAGRIWVMVPIVTLIVPVIAFIRR
jgi:hypothetical protein